MVFLKMSQTFFIETFGCQMNVHDSEKIAGILCKEGYVPTDDPGNADLIIYNTCSIRQKAEQKFFSELGRTKSLKKKKPHLRIAVAGCIAQQQQNAIFRRAPYVDFIFGPQSIHRLNDLIRGLSCTALDEDSQLTADSEVPVRRKPGGRAWVSIMFGCNNFCSYCIVPYTRGRERSRPSENIVREVEELAQTGFKEVTLLGQNVNSYSNDTDFPGLLKKINSIAGIERIRFVTSHPRDLSEKLIRAMSEFDKVCEHIHLPLQSGSSKVLNLMNRGYSFDDYRKKIAKLRNTMKNLSITTDIIAGFPGETDEDHEDTMDALREIEFDGIFAFKYSTRPLTAAASMDDHSDVIKSQRLAEILDIQDGITLNLNKNLENSLQEILVEGTSETNSTMLTGRTRTNKIVNFRGNSSQITSIMKIKIVKAKKHSLLGSLV
jgi:tRNA-2-methylthio-N6-dimethylallyladenosine synthase